MSGSPPSAALRIAFAAALLIAVALVASAEPIFFHPSRPRIVAHAMGSLTVKGTNGVKRTYAYTNSLEAFKQNYAKGTRIFEVDLIPTRDGKLVARHDWSPELYKALGQPYLGGVPSQAEFMATKVLGSRHPLDVEAIAQLMREHRDMSIITDTKYLARDAVLAEMRALRSQLGPDRDELCRRIAIQIYDEPMLETVRSVYQFPNVIYTLYQLKETSGAIDFCRANRIPVIAFDMQRWSPKFAAAIRAAGIGSAVYTVNSPTTARMLQSRGVSYIYSDRLRPADLSTFKWTGLAGSIGTPRR